MPSTPNLRILHIASGDLWAGAEVQLYTLVTSLHCTFNVPVNVVLLNHGTLEKKLQKAGVPVIVLDESTMSGLNILRSLVRVIKNLKPSIIHTHRVKENILGSIAARLTGQIPSLRTTHGAPEHRPSWKQIPKHIIRTLDWLTGRILQNRIIAVSEDLSRILGKNFPTEKIRTIENGLDIEAIQSQATKQNPDENAYPTTITVGLAGRLVPIKRVDLFIEAAQYIQEHYPGLKISFHIFGDGPLRDELENLSKKLGTENIVHFEGHCDNLPQQLQGLNALLMTSDHEGLPMILLEAMALQVPIVSHAVGGIPQLLDNGSCGTLIHEQNAPAYANVIQQLQQHPQKFLDLTKNALNRAQTVYSAKRNAKDYLSIYYELIQNVNQTPKQPHQ